MRISQQIVPDMQLPQMESEPPTEAVQKIITNQSAFKFSELWKQSVKKTEAPTP